MDKMKILRLLLITAIVVIAISTPSFAVEYFLRADVTTKDMPGEPNIPMWGFAMDSAFDANDGTVTVPGPMLTVPPGDSNLTIHLDNNLSVPVSIVINGQTAVMTPVKFTDPQGRQRIRSFTHETEPNNVAPVDYVWNNFQPGSYIYESGTHPAVQVQMGLYGAAVMDYAAGSGSIAGYVYENEPYETVVPLIFSEIDPAVHNAVDSNDYGPGLGMTSTIDYEPKYFLINGEPFESGDPAIPAGTHGGGTLLRLFNMGLQTRSVLLQGSGMSLIAEDGQPYMYSKDRYTALLNAGKTIDAMVAFPAAGTYPIYDRMLDLTNGPALGGGMQAYLDVGAGNFWPVINSVTATPASISDMQTSQLLVDASDSDGPSPLSYSWDIPLGAGSLDDPTIANPVFTPSYIEGSQTYTLTVTVSDGLNFDIGTVDVTVTGSLFEVIVDNADINTSSIGVWLPSGAPDFWATDSIWANDAGDSFTFNANLVPGITYQVYEWHTAWPSRYTAVPHEIRAGATLLGTVNVNQQIDGGVWNLLGAYTFTEAAASVTIPATPGYSTNADAVRFVPVTTPVEMIIDNLDATTSSVGVWSPSGAAGFWATNSVWANDAGDSFTLYTNLIPGTTYQVYEWHTAWPSRYTAVPHQIRTGATLLGTVNVNQQADGGMWNLLGTYTFTEATASVTILATPGYSTNADAIRFVPVTTPVEIVVDNLDAAASSVGVWLPSGASGFWATDSVWANDLGDTFTFAANLVPGTNYEVYEWHTQWPSRYTAVPHEIRTGVTLLATINVDQQIDGGQWNLLGTYTFTEAAASVTIPATPGYSTNADAVRFVPVP